MHLINTEWDDTPVSGYESGKAFFLRTHCFGPPKFQQDAGLRSRIILNTIFM